MGSDSNKMAQVSGQSKSDRPGTKLSEERATSTNHCVDTKSTIRGKTEGECRDALY